jgi:hypothetical protein
MRMPDTLQDRDWNLLLRRIKAGKCTPFLGAGACFGVLPLGGKIAQDWAQEFGYPLEDHRDLSRVAQYLAVQFDPMFPKEEILKYFMGVTPPDFTEPNEPHGVLANLPLPVYITTNYDDFMVKALKSHTKDPKRELCRWNELVRDYPSIFDSAAAFEPTPADPVVYHLHGHTEVPESMVLTDDDYLDFLVSISRKEALLPHQIQRAITGSSLLFIGYSLADWSFRVLYRGLVSATEKSLRRISVTVQLPPTSGGSQDKADSIENYLSQYFGKTDMKVAWCTAREFCAELRQRWDDFSPRG